MGDQQDLENVDDNIGTSNALHSGTEDSSASVPSFSEGLP